jgi:hypothetical protein
MCKLPVRPLMAAFCLILPLTTRAADQPQIALQGAVYGKQYSVQLHFRAEGMAPITFSVVGGALPSCMRLSPDGILRGMPYASCRGTYAFVAGATSYDGVQTPQRYMLQVTDGTVVPAPAPLPRPAPAPSATAPAAGGGDPQGKQPVTPPASVTTTSGSGGPKQDATEQPKRLTLLDPKYQINNCAGGGDYKNAKAPYRNLCQLVPSSPKPDGKPNPDKTKCAAAPDIPAPEIAKESTAGASQKDPTAVCSAEPVLLKFGAIEEEKAAFSQLEDIRSSKKCEDVTTDAGLLTCQNYVCGLGILKDLAQKSSTYLSACAAAVATRGQQGKGSASGGGHSGTNANSNPATDAINQSADGAETQTIYTRKAEFWSNLAKNLDDNKQAVNSGSYALNEQLADPYALASDDAIKGSGQATAPDSSSGSGGDSTEAAGGSGGDTPDPGGDTPAPKAKNGAPASPSSLVSVTQPPAAYSAPLQWYRIGLGVDLTGASSTDATGRIMADLATQIPLRGTGCPPSDEINPCISYLARNWINGLVRIDSIAQPGAISGLANASSYFQSAASATPQQEVYSIEALLGYDLDLLFMKSLRGTTRPYFTVNLGAITPLSPDQASPSIYDLSGAIEAAYANSVNSAIFSKSCPQTTAVADTNTQLSFSPGTNETTECYVAFLSQGRDRFYRHYEAGFRLKHFAPDTKSGDEHFPAIFDAEVGQNEYVTGGEMRGLVGHFSGSTYFPSDKIHGLYLFGSMDLALTKSQNFQAVLLQAPSSLPAITASNVAVINVPQPNRDRWRIGFSIDIAEVIKELGKKPSPNQ